MGANKYSVNYGMSLDSWYRKRVNVAAQRPLRKCLPEADGLRLSLKNQDPHRMAGCVWLAVPFNKTKGYLKRSRFADAV